MWHNKEIGKDEPKRVYVASFDILGFKNQIETLGTKELNKSLMMLNSIKNMANTTKFLDTPKNKNIKIPDVSILRGNVAQFSDTVIFSTFDDTIESLLGVIYFAKHFMQGVHAVSKIPIRGGIGIGDMIWLPKSQQAIGTAIIDAYLTEQRLASVGCLLSKNVESEMNKPGLNKVLNVINEHFPEIGNRTLEIEKVPVQSSKNGKKRYDVESGTLINWLHSGLTEDATSNLFPSTPDDHVAKLKENSMYLHKIMYDHISKAVEKKSDIE